MRKGYKAALGVAGVLLACSGANARVIQIQNGDFETGSILQEGAGESAVNRPIQGWTASSGISTTRWNPSSGLFTDQAAHGYAASVAGNGIRATPNGSMLAQIVEGEVLRANTRYVLTLDVGKASSATSYWGYDVGLISDLGASGAFILGNKRGNDGVSGTFKTITFEFQTASSGPGIGKRFAIALGGQSSPFGDYANFDNVRLEAFAVGGGVPEPASWAMMIGGFALTGAAVRRRKPQMALV